MGNGRAAGRSQRTGNGQAVERSRLKQDLAEPVMCVGWCFCALGWLHVRDLRKSGTYHENVDAWVDWDFAGYCLQALNA